MSILLGILGLIIGTFVILFGGGGAAIYLGILTGMLRLGAAAAASTSLITALPSLLIGAYSYTRQGKIDFKIGNQMLITAIPAVIIGSLGAHFIPNTVYTWLVGLILLVLGLNMLWQYFQTAHEKKAPSPTTYPRLKAGLYGGLGGLMVGVAGMSGGAVIIAGLFLLRLKAFRATATSTYVVAAMTIIGALFHTAAGQVNWQAGLPLMIGAILGALIAPRLALVLAKTRITNYLKPVIGILLAILGLKSLL